MNRRKKTAINIASSFMFEFVVMVCGLITPRLILGAFGSTYNGVISSATQLLSMISFLTLGISGAVRAELYHSLAHNDYEGTSSIMKAATNYMRKVGLVLIVFAIVLMFFFPFISHSNIPHSECAMIIGIIAIDSFCLYFLGTANYSLLIADQKSYIKSFLGIAAKILSTIVIVVIINRGGNIFEVKGASALVMTIPPIGVAFYVEHHYKLDKKCEPRKDALKKRNDAAVHSLANIVHDNTDTIILTAFLDIKLVSVYTVYYAIVGKIKTLIKGSATSIEAAFGNMWANQEMKALQKSFKAYEYAMAMIVVIVFSCIGVLLVPFIELYTSNVSDVNYLRFDFALLITAAEAVFCLRQPYRTLVHATGFFKETKNPAIIEAVINLIISIVLVNIIGLNGVVVGTLVANVYRTGSYAYFVSHHILNRSIKVVWLRMAWTVMGSMIAIFCSNLQISMIQISGWVGWLVKGLITFLTSSVVSLVLSVIFYRSDLNVIVRFIRHRFVKH
ncbi:lipopolysaccharide biosynthesis protein [Oribacterium sp. NK2B42]|uniref:lipopolysaccharide biosynthesis protein n=1 Tax=Oribacterium sp. NK2B42 TaxID=689781 RepID=UPI0012EB890F|nr:hypothetical protein [Oribacterium sp. NK2B42]